MKIMVYEARPDERADLEKKAALHGVELSVTDAVTTLEIATLAARGPVPRPRLRPPRQQQRQYTHAVPSATRAAYGPSTAFLYRM